jgi:RNA polymerase sigma factor (sigma-70 family)
MDDASIKLDLAAAADGDGDAWARLVARFAGLVWSVVRAHRLGPEDAADLTQATWLKLVEHLDRIADPERLGAWLATTARRECLQFLRRAPRQPLASTDDELERGAPEEQPPETAVLEAERDAALWRALHALPDRCQLLLRLLLVEPRLGYEDIGELLGMPIGSIGPNRARCLERLRQRAKLEGIDFGTRASS